DSPQAAASGGGARSLPTELTRRDGSGSPLESKIDVIGTLPRLGGAESSDRSSADRADDAEDPTAETGGSSAEAGAGPAARGGKAKSAGKKSAGAKTRGQQGLATSVDELELDLDDAKDEIARAK